MRPELILHNGSAWIVAATSELGGAAVAVEHGHLIGVAFGHKSAADAARRLVQTVHAGGNAFDSIERRPPSNAEARVGVAALDRIVRYLNGEPVLLGDLPVSLEHLSPFQRRVARACQDIPAGETRTYGQLAAAAGSPGAARAVGQVMAGNRTPLVVPCHRVVAAGGGLGGFSAPQGLEMKRRLLALEAEPSATPAPKKTTGRRPSLALAT